MSDDDKTLIERLKARSEALTRQSYVVVAEALILAAEVKPGATREGETPADGVIAEQLKRLDAIDPAR